MFFVLCILLCAAGYMVRGGWPATGSTQLARVIGGALCTAGAIAMHPSWVGVAFGLSVFIGFWTDQKHAAGQGAATWKDAGYLALSGVTSLAPLAIVAAVLVDPSYILVMLVGLVKPPIWFGWWRLNSSNWSTWTQPTRLADITFGAIIGLCIALL